MNPHLLANALWAILCLAEAILAGVILKKGAAQRWPFLLAVTLFDLAYSALLYAHLGRIHYRQYFNIYYYGQGARALLSLGVLWDVSRTLPILKFVPRRMGLMLIVLGLTVTIGAVYLTSQHHSHTYPLTAQVLMIQECINVAWMCFAAVLLGSVSLLGLGWGLEAVNITGGVVASGMVAMVSYTLTSSWPKYGHLIDLIQTGTEIAVFSYWSVVLCRPPLADEVLSDSALNVVNELFEEQSLV